MDSNLWYRGTKARNSEASRVEDLAFVVDGTPETHSLASDPSNRFVQMPSIARAGRRRHNRRAVSGPELQHPAPEMSSPLAKRSPTSQ
jgi:hypothetical protein